MSIEQQPRQSLENPIQLPLTEINKSPEKMWEPKFALLVISGPPGAGTSTLARSLAELTGARLYKAGDTMREMEDISERAPGFIVRDEDVDNAVDDRVSQMYFHASTSEPAIAEAQIGALTVLDAKRKLALQDLTQDEPVVRILLRARKEVRDQRVYKASREKGDINPETNRPYTLEEIQKRNSSRERGDLAWWKQLYPDLIGKDHPHSLGARDAHGSKIYNLEFDNSDQETPEETLTEVIESLREMGHLTPVEHTMKPGKEAYLPSFGEKVRSFFNGFPKRKTAN